MDGMTDEDLSTPFKGQNHQLAVLPDGTIAFYADGSAPCDDIKERAPDGAIKTIVNAGTAQNTTKSCHINNIQYSPTDEAVRGRGGSTASTSLASIRLSSSTTTTPAGVVGSHPTAPATAPWPSRSSSTSRA